MIDLWRRTSAVDVSADVAVDAAFGIVHFIFFLRLLLFVLQNEIFSLPRRNTFVKLIK